MKTNLTTKQIKKIQNGKSAIFKDIDTADAREYLLKVLDWLFPNDKDTNKQRAVEVGLYFYAFCDTTWCNEKVELKAINLSQIMYTYNTEQFKPISMPCTQEQYNNDLKPVVEAFGIDFSGVLQWEVCDRITNNYGKGKIIGCYFDTMDKHGKLLPTYSPSEFLEACGIVRADKVEDNAMVQETFKIYYNGICIFKNGNFAKVIKSAELIKAEEELEQAYIKVESLKNN